MALGGSTAGTVLLNVSPDLSNFHRVLSGQILRSKSRLGGVGKVAGLAIAGGVGVGLAALGKVITDSLGAAQEALQVEAQTRAALKSTKGIANVTEKDIARLSSTIMNYAAVSDESVREGLNMLLTFKNIRNGVGQNNKMFDQSAHALANLSTVMKTDMRGSSIMLGKALNDPIRGLTAMRRVGIQFTDQQEKQITAMVEASDVAGAQTIILEELNSQFGGQARAVGNTKPWEKFKLAVDEAKEAIGTALLPTLQRLARRLTRFVQSEKFKEWVRTASKWLRENLPKAIDKAIGAFNLIKDNLSTVKTALEVVAVGWVALKTAAITSAAASALAWTAAAGPIGLAAAGIVTAGYLIMTNWDAIKEKVRKVVAWMIDKWADMYEFFVRWGDKFLAAAEKAFGWMPSIGDKVKLARDAFQQSMNGIIHDLREVQKEFDGTAEKFRKLMLRLMNPVNIAVDFRALNMPAYDGEGILGTQGGTARAIAGSAIQRFGGMITSGYRPGAITSSGNKSYHSDPNNPAMDFVGSRMTAAAGWIASTFGSKVRELIHTPLGFGIKHGAKVPLSYFSDAVNRGHYNHVHVADRGSIIKGPAVIAQGNITEAHTPLKNGVLPVALVGGFRGHITGTLHTDFGPARIEGMMHGVAEEVVGDALHGIAMGGIGA